MRDWLVILMLVMAAWEGGATATTPNLPKRIQCLQNTVDVPARHLMSNGEIIKFRMEMSQRVTHQLVTHIFAIYVQEVLGYQGVELLVSRDNFNTTHYLSRLTESTNSIDSVPDVIANLELWLPPETSLYSQKVHDHFREAGNSGPPGRFGWFFPRRHLGATPTMDHYSVLQSPNSSAIFAVGAGELEALRRRYGVNATSGKYFCDADVCKDGVFTPKRCVNRQHQCALLLTSHYDATSFVVEHINHLGLFVQVLWVGDNLESAVQDMHNVLETEEAALHARQRRSDEAALEESRWLSDEALLHGPHRRSFVFLHWTPSRLVVPEDDRYVSVAFPPCESLSSTAADGCKYDLNRLVKIIWSRLDKAGPYIHNALINMEFKASDYRDLLQRYERGLALGRGIYDVACDWMRDNLAVYERWTAETVDVSELYIGGIFPVLIPEYNGQGILWASKMAVDAVNANSSVLSGYKLTLLPKDGKCRSDAVIKSFVEFIKADRFPKLAGILGPACSDSVEPLAGVATIYKTVVMSYSAEGSNFSDRVKYPYFFRTIGENYQYTMLASRLCSLHLAPLGRTSIIRVVQNSKLPSTKSTGNDLFRLYSNQGQGRGSWTKASPRRRTFKEIAMQPASGAAINVGTAAVAGGAAVGIGALCFYGLGFASKPGAIDRSMMWPEYVKDRIRSTYVYFGTSIGLTAASAYACFNSPVMVNMMMKNSLLAIGLSIAAMIGTSIIARSIPYTEGFGIKQAAWALHTSVIGAVLAPICFVGGPILVRAAWYTAGIVGGLSTVAACAPSEQFLNMAAPLGIGLGVVFAASLGSMFLAPTTALGSGLYSISLYGGLLVFSGFLLYDTQKIIKHAETHSPYAIDKYDPINMSMSIYMDTINIFIRIVSILSNGGSSKRR